MKSTVAIVSFIIVIILLYFAYDYLNKLESCMCAQGYSVNQIKANIRHLKYIEMFLIILATLNFFFAFRENLSPMISTIFFFVMIGVYVYFVMNVYNLYKNMPNDCGCALKWPRYFLYIQTLLYTFALLTFFVSIFVIVNISLNNRKK